MTQNISSFSLCSIKAISWKKTKPIVESSFCLLSFLSGLSKTIRFIKSVSVCVPFYFTQKDSRWAWLDKFQWKSQMTLFPALYKSVHQSWTILRKLLIHAQTKLPKLACCKTKRKFSTWPSWIYAFLFLACLQSQKEWNMPRNWTSQHSLHKQVRIDPFVSFLPHPTPGMSTLPLFSVWVGYLKHWGTCLALCKHYEQPLAMYITVFVQNVGV